MIEVEACFLFDFVGAIVYELARARESRVQTTDGSRRAAINVSGLWTTAFQGP
jgi:hypothetical protein